MKSAIAPWHIALAYAVTACALLFPLFTVAHPQSIDLANHLARLYVRGHQATSPALASFYEYRSMLFPYLAVETLSRPLLLFLDVYQTGRALMGMSVLLWLAAPALLYRALWKEWSLWPLLSSLVVYNANTAWGFTDYTITSALAMIGLAGWIASEGAKAVPRATGSALAGFAIYCCHLQGFVVFGLLIGGYELGKMIQDRTLKFRDFIFRGLLLAPLFLPGVLHFLYLSFTQPPVQALGTTPASWADRVLVLASPFMNGLHTGSGTQTLQDISTAAPLLLVAAYALLAFRKAITVHKYMIVSLVLLTLLALFIPPRILGISFTHYRLPFVAVALLIASTQPKMTGDILYKLLAAAFVLVLGSRLADMSAIWQRYDAQAQEFIREAAVIKPGSKALVVNREYPSRFVEHYHTGSLLTVERQAFIPNLFTVMQFFRAKGDYARISHPNATHPMDARNLQVAVRGKDARLKRPGTYFRTWWKDYDYVVAYESGTDKPFMPALLKPVARGSYFVIYEVNKARKKT